jgi:capsular polysaccharide biosynthesis protein
VAGQNQLLDLLRVLRRRRYQVLVPALLVASVGIAFAVIVPKRYRVLTRIEISDRTRVEFDSRLKNPHEVAVRREAPSASDHIRNYMRIKEVMERNLSQWPEYVATRGDIEQGQFIHKRILANLTAAPTTKDPRSGSIFIEVGFSDEDRDRAARFLKDLTESWLTEMRESDRSTLISEGVELQRILDVQSADLKDKEDRLYALIELLGQDPTAPSSGDRREERGDWTFRTLERARTDLADVELKLRTAEFELEQAREHLAAEPPTIPKRMPAATGARAEELAKKKLARQHLEDKLANLRPSNSTYRKLKPKLDELTLEIQALEGLEPEASERWEEEENPRVEEYEGLVRERRDLVGTLQDQRDALVATVEDLLQESKARTQHHKHLEDLRNQVNEARIRVNDTRREWQDREKSLQILDSSPTPWRITQPPVPASAATQPNPLLLSAFAVVAGLALGVGLALLSEYARGCYRNVADLAAVMSVPVLGAIDTIVTRRERRRLQLSHAAAGLSTAVIVGTIGWITWLWHSAPERLPLELQDAIERLRSALK